MAMFLRRLLVTMAKVLLGFSALIVLIIAFGIYSNQRAIKAAEHFCDQIALGSDLSQSMQAARTSGIRYIEPLHQFHFQGWLFNAAVCALTVEGNKVLSKRVEMLDD